MHLVTTNSWTPEINGKPAYFTINIYVDNEREDWFTILRNGADYADDICGADNLDSIQQAIVKYEEGLENTKCLKCNVTRDSVLTRLEAAINEYGQLTY